MAATVGPGQLASDVRKASLVAASFFWRHVLLEVQQAPWSLASGNIAANLEKLARQPQVPQDVCARKIQQLARLKWMPAIVQEAVALLAHVSWTTVVVEQGHASATLMHRAHPEYNEDILLARSVLHSARSLLPDDIAHTKRAREDERAQRLLRLVPGRTSGFNMYYKEAHATLSAHRGSGLTQEAKESLMTRAHTAWRALSPRRKATYDKMAKEHASQRVMSIAETARAHAEQVRLRRDLLLVEQCTDFGPPRLGTCRWTAQDMTTMAAMEQSTHFSSQRVCDLRALAVLPVERPSDLELTELAGAGAPTFPKDGDVYPSWASCVCASRDEF